MNLTKSEQKIVDELELSGCEVLRNGWPDFLVKKPDGSIKAIEVKCGKDKITKCQRAMHDALERCGIEVDVRIVDEHDTRIAIRIDRKLWNQFIVIVEATRRSRTSVINECIELGLPVIASALVKKRKK